MRTLFHFLCIENLRWTQLNKGHCYENYKFDEAQTTEIILINKGIIPEWKKGYTEQSMKWPQLDEKGKLDKCILKASVDTVFWLIQ
jgi:hypothetical protein